MERDILDVLNRRISSLRISSAIVLTALLINAGLVLLLVASAGSVLASLIALGAMASVIVVAALFFDSFLTSAKGARPLRAGEFPWLEPMVDDLAQRAGISPPRVLISDQDDVNAYATGTGARSKVVFFRGLLHELPRDQVQAVAAREVGHVANRDVALAIWTGAVLFWVLVVRGFASQLGPRPARQRRSPARHRRPQLPRQARAPATPGDAYVLTAAATTTVEGGSMLVAITGSNPAAIDTPFHEVHFSNDNIPHPLEDAVMTAFADPSCR